MNYMFIANDSDLIDKVLQWTGSSDRQEIRNMIQFAELRMRNLEIPALRTNVFDSDGVLYTDSEGKARIPADMLKPVLFWQEGSTVIAGTGGTPSINAPYGNSVAPWIVYNRQGDREIIRRLLTDQFYIKPINIPRIIEGSFGEVGQYYVFTPNPGPGTKIRAYYYRAWPFLGTPTTQPNVYVTNNVVLQSFPEGYLYGTLTAYYEQKKNPQEAEVWAKRFADAWAEIEKQNYKGKFTGGNNAIVSAFQPRRYRFQTTQR